jgi:hypothetical protein
MLYTLCMNTKVIESRLPELAQIELFKSKFNPLADFQVLTNVESKVGTLPIYQIKFKSTAETRPTKQNPVLFLVGGVHGLERIGTRVILSLLEMLFSRLEWDEALKNHLSHFNLVSIPLLNPGGMVVNSRANPNGVDLMRNAPVEAIDKVPFLIGGHKISSKLMWYRGSETLEIEAQALCESVKNESFDAPFTLAVDFHSGFGLQDQIWFPYAKTKRPFPNLAEAFALKELIKTAHPHHFYKIEPQALNYVTHGDLWDYLYDLPDRKNLFLPITLEMGSWLWVKKNPRQLFGLKGFFNPLKEHRLKRILRRHWTLFDILMSATANWQNWGKLSEVQKKNNEELALQEWYS